MGNGVNDVKLYCPRCEQKLSIPSAMLGEVFKCPSCDMEIVLPEPQAVAAIHPGIAPEPSLRGPERATRSKYRHRTPYPAGSYAVLIFIVVALAVVAGGVFYLHRPARTVYDIRVPPDPDLWRVDTRFQDIVARLTPEQQELIYGYGHRVKTGESRGNKLLPWGKTIGDVLAEQQAWLEWQKGRSVPLVPKPAPDAETAKAQDMMRSILSAVLRDLEFEEADADRSIFQSRIALEVAFTNHTPREIVRVDGTGVLRDLSGNKIRHISIELRARIKPHSQYTWKRSFPYNGESEGDRRLIELSFEEVGFEFTPRVYEFSDGTRVSVRDLSRGLLPALSKPAAEVTEQESEPEEVRSEPEPERAQAVETGPAGPEPAEETVSPEVVLEDAPEEQAAEQDFKPVAKAGDIPGKSPAGPVQKSAPREEKKPKPVAEPPPPREDRYVDEI